MTRPNEDQYKPHNHRLTEASPRFNHSVLMGRLVFGLAS